jgi:hypothetical protein
MPLWTQNISHHDPSRVVGAGCICVHNCQQRNKVIYFPLILLNHSYEQACLLFINVYSHLSQYCLLLEYDLNSNQSFAGTLGGPVVRVRLISGFVFYCTIHCIHPIYASCKSHRKTRRLIVFSPFSKLFTYSEDCWLVPVVFFSQEFSM